MAAMLSPKKPSSQRKAKTILSHAPLWRRLLAILYDFLLLFGLSMIFGFVYVFSKKAIFNIDNFDASTTAAGDPLMLLLWFAVIYSFFYWFWSRSGKTLGMQSWRLVILSKDGSPINAKQTFIRLCIAPLSVLCFGMGFWWGLGSKKQTWQDIVSHTQIHLTPKVKKEG